MKPLTPEHALAMLYGVLLIRGDDELPDDFKCRQLALRVFDVNGEIVTEPEKELER